MTEKEFIHYRFTGGYKVRLTEKLNEEDLYKWDCQGDMVYYNNKMNTIFSISPHFSHSDPSSENKYISFMLKSGFGGVYPSTLYIKHSGLSKLKVAVTGYLGFKSVLSIHKVEKIRNTK